MNVVLVLLAFWLPGLLIGAALRLRGWTLAALAPALTFGSVALGVLVIGGAGIRWNVTSYGVWVAALAVVCLIASVVVGRVGRRRAADAETDAEADTNDEDGAGPLTIRQHLIVAGGVVIGLAVGAITFLRGTVSLDTVNQDFDGPFHGNAVRWIAEFGNPLPSALAPTANQAGKADYFYPDTYHALLALLLDKPGLPMAALLNLAALAGILAFPIGIAALGLAWRLPPIAVGVAAAVSTWFGAYPYDSLWRGPLWPFVAGVALVPAVLAVTRQVFWRDRDTPLLAAPVGLALATAGLAGLHTSLAFVLAVYWLVLLVAMVLRIEPVDWRAARWPVGLAAVAGLVIAVPVVLPAVSGSGIVGARWPEFATPAEGFGQVLLVSPVAPFPQWWLGLPALAGFVLLVVARRMRWLVAAYLALGGLYAACASLDHPLVNKLTGPFYNDAWRLAALLPVGGAIAVGWFVHRAAQWLTAKAGDRVPAVATGRAVAVAPLVAAALVLAVLAVLGQGAYIGRNVDRLAIQHYDGGTISTGERRAMAWIAERDPGGRVMNDRSDGSVWMYALEGLQPVEWTFYGTERRTDAGLLTARLNKFDEDAEVRRVVAELGVRYVLVGDGFVRPGATRSPGLVGLTLTPGLRLVYSNPDAMVYEIDASATPTP